VETETLTASSAVARNCRKLQDDDRYRNRCITLTTTKNNHRSVNRAESFFLVLSVCLSVCLFVSLSQFFSLSVVSLGLLDCEFAQTGYIYRFSNRELSVHL